MCILNSEQIKNVAAIATVIIALVVGFIAFLQYRLAHEKIKQDLFDRRFKIYKAVETFLRELMVNPPDILQERLQNFADDTQTAQFIFGYDIISYVEKVTNMAKAYRYQTGIIAHEFGNELTEAKKSRIKIAENANNEANALPQTFARYLKFKE